MRIDFPQIERDRSLFVLSCRAPIHMQKDLSVNESDKIGKFLLKENNIHAHAKEMNLGYFK